MGISRGMRIARPRRVEGPGDVHKVKVGTGFGVVAVMLVHLGHPLLMRPQSFWVHAYSPGSVLLCGVPVSISSKPPAEQRRRVPVEGLLDCSSPTA